MKARVIFELCVPKCEHEMKSKNDIQGVHYCMFSRCHHHDHDIKFLLSCNTILLIFKGLS